MTVNNDLVTLEEVKQYYDITGSKPEDDEFIEELIHNVTDLFESYCGVDSFISQSYTEYVDGAGGKYLYLKNRPITYITSISYDDDWMFDEVFISGVYKIVNNSYVVMRDDILYEGDQNIKVVYTAGYSDVPGDLKLACMEEVIKRFKNRAIFDLLSRSLPDGSAQYVEKGLLKSTREILSKYKSMRAF